ncbi:MAG: 4Fe-4S binding protein [Clostridia bacterium]|jgi:NADP-reducing hydrogenase subunit HndD|nr:4Fe-4S binding protein [Clostridia bacterium]
MQKTVNLKINNIPVTIPEGTTILQAARIAHIEIPTLCYLKDVSCVGSCRMCVVEATGARGLVAACVYPVAEGMEVRTNTEKCRQSRKMTLELILSKHKKKCLSCERNHNCELQKLSLGYSVDEDRFKGEDFVLPIDVSTPYVVRDNDKCINCMRCVAACQKQTVNAIGPIGRGFHVHIGSAFDLPLSESPCVGCGQCIVACPVGALSERSNIDDVWDALSDPTKKVIFFTAPSVRATLGEAFDLPVGTNVEGKMVAAIRRLNPHAVFNMDVTADLTIMEEASELINRIKTGKPMPMFTSCCPAWIKFAEQTYPEMIPHLSTCKSPQQMFGALLKSYWCEKNGVSPKNLFVVSVIPCTAKKYECGREEMKNDVDVALTTRELARMIKTAGIKFTELPDEEFDNPFATATGAGAIFGATGGVMEAALRTAAHMMDGGFEVLDFPAVRGDIPVKEASYSVAGHTVRVAVASGLSNARKVIEQIKSGEKKYDFIEIMSCPGGCVNGGGQPTLSDSVRNSVELKEARAKALYESDTQNKLRRSADSPVMDVIYDDYFGFPNSHKAHDILHTTYKADKRI